MNERHTITIHREVYQRLKKKGLFGESYSDVLSRLLDSADGGLARTEEDTD
ncbi:MAG: antitoxin VapB family protein [Candidatus Nitrosopolaris sp.]|jgi:predicted CopG family antitoxin